MVVFGNAWNLSTTVTEIRGSELAPYIAQFQENVIHQDPWLRSMVWTIKVAQLLSTNGHNYIQAIADMQRRIRLANKVRAEMISYQNRIVSILKGFNLTKWEKRCYLKDFTYPYISVAINSWALPALTIGKYGHPLYYSGSEQIARENILHDYRSVNRFYGEMTIHPEALDLDNNNGKHDSRDALPYYQYVMMHEMIHAIFGPKCNVKEHGPRFQRIATAMNIPKKYQD